MKYLIALVAVSIFFGCHKSSNSAFSYQQALDTMHIPVGKPCICNKVPDTLTFFADGWVNEKTDVHNISFQLTMSISYISLASGLPANTLQIAIKEITDTVSYGRFNVYSDCLFYRNIGGDASYITSGENINNHAYAALTNNIKIYFLP